MEYLILIIKLIFFFILFLILTRLFSSKEKELSFIFYGFLLMLCFLNIAHFISFIKLVISFSLWICFYLFIYFLKDSNLIKKIISNPNIFIVSGRLKIYGFLKSNLSLFDLYELLKKYNIKNIREVRYAIMEPDGTVTIIKKHQDQKTNNLVPIIINGKVDYEALDIIKKDSYWLESNIDIDPEDISYSFYNNDKLYIIHK